MDSHERRHCPRQIKTATVQVLPAPDDPEGRGESIASITGQICNQSDDGVYIEIDRALLPGSNIRLKMSPLHRPDSGEPYFASDGRVVRYENIDEKCPRFGVGIKILRKVVRAPILSSRFK